MSPEGQYSTQKSEYYGFHRTHYCGVCKSIGKNYSAKDRLLLNYDAVYLAELLSLLADEDISSWETNLVNVNQCFKMPKENLPKSIAYAADAGMFLYKLKTEDHIHDSKNPFWYIFKLFFQGSFGRSVRRLKQIGLDVSSLTKMAADQNRIEKINFETGDLDEFLSFYAAPTAKITAYIFEKGAVQIGRDDLALSFAQLGHAFGKLIYLIDAYEDIEKDAYLRQFNPLLKFFNAKETINHSAREEVRCIIYNVLRENENAIEQLNVSELSKENILARLNNNVTQKLHKDPVIIRSLKDSILNRWSNAKKMADSLTCRQESEYAKKLNYSMMSVAFFIAPETEDYISIGEGSNSFMGWTVISSFLAAIGFNFILKKERKKKRNRCKPNRGIRGILDSDDNGLANICYAGLGILLIGILFLALPSTVGFGYFLASTGSILIGIWLCAVLFKCCCTSLDENLGCPLDNFCSTDSLKSCFGLGNCSLGDGGMSSSMAEARERRGMVKDKKAEERMKIMAGNSKLYNEYMTKAREEESKNKLNSALDYYKKAKAVSISGKNSAPKDIARLKKEIKENKDVTKRLNNEVKRYISDANFRIDNTTKERLSQDIKDQISKNNSVSEMNALSDELKKYQNIAEAYSKLADLLREPYNASNVMESIKKSNQLASEYTTILSEAQKNNNTLAVNKAENYCQEHNKVYDGICWIDKKIGLSNPEKYMFKLESLKESIGKEYIYLHSIIDNKLNKLEIKDFNYINSCQEP